MDNAIYATLNRQSGLMREMQAVANNIANLSTPGFRKEGVVFTEFVAALGRDDALSMANADGRIVSAAQGELRPTGGTYDFAIDGTGYFQIETPEGPQLTRAGSFTPSADGELVTSDGHRLLDSGGAPIAVPPGALSVALAPDGTLSADGSPIAQLGLFRPVNATDLVPTWGTRLAAAGGVEPVDEDAGVIRQGFLEGSNVNAVQEVARMIEVQRAYELGQTFLDREDQRIRAVISTFSR